MTNVNINLFILAHTKQFNSATDSTESLSLAQGFVSTFPETIGLLRNIIGRVYAGGIFVVPLKMSYVLIYL